MFESADIFTNEGHITVLDRAGGTIKVTVEDLDLTTMDLWFEAGSVSIEMTGVADLKQCSLLPEHLDVLADESVTRYALINKDVTPNEPIWEGYIYIRTVD